jgi:hypothetical protein
VISLSLAAAIPLHAATATVDCSGATPGAFTSINAALATLDAFGPHTINVSGTCIENVAIRNHDRITLQGVPTATVQAPVGVAMLVQRSRNLTLRHLTIRNGARALFVTTQSEAVIEDVVLENSGNGLVVDNDSIVTSGGPLLAHALNIHGHGFGVVLDGATFFANGNVTIENNGTGVDAEASRLAFIGSPTAVNLIRNNTGNGIFAHGGTDLDFRGTNTIEGNALDGILAFENTSVDVLGSTTINANLRGGIALIFNSSGRLANVTLTNNGTAGDPFSSGVTSAQNSSLIVNVSTISGTAGPGVIVEAGGMARVFSTTSDAMRVSTGGILELQAGNTIAGNPQVACDSTATIFGEGSGVTTDCKKVK